MNESLGLLISDMMHLNHLEITYNKTLLFRIHNHYCTQGYFLLLKLPCILITVIAIGVFIVAQPYSNIYPLKMADLLYLCIAIPCM